MCEFSLVEETSAVSPRGYFISILLPCQLEAGGRTRGIKWTTTYMQFLSRIVFLLKLHNAQVLKILPAKFQQYPHVLFAIPLCSSHQANLSTLQSSKSGL